eukprot:SAG11_NODE_15587_length_573_cov_0.535865_1_plen_21_part_10
MEKALSESGGKAERAAELVCL